METKHTVKTKYYTFDEYLSNEYASGLKGKVATQLMRMYKTAVAKDVPVILELGTAKGQSTTVFLQACEEKNGRLVSVDIADCADIAISSKWHFVQSDTTDIEFILSRTPFLKNGIDILYIDSLHSLVHVEKELTVWYPYMNEQSWIFFDDVDSNPYRNRNRKDNFSREVSRDEIHDYVKSFFYGNEDDLYLDIMYGSTGLACLYKLSPRGTVPNNAKHIVHRGKNVVNI